MEILTTDIILVSFYSAIFLMVISVPKILILLGWFGWSNWTYTSNGKLRKRAVERFVGESGLEEISKKRNENQLRLVERTTSGLKEPIIEAIASLSIILLTVPYLAFNEEAIGLVNSIEVILVASILIGIVSISYLVLKLTPYMRDVMQDSRRPSDESSQEGST